MRLGPVRLFVLIVILTSVLLLPAQTTKFEHYVSGVRPAQGSAPVEASADRDTLRLPAPATTGEVTTGATVQNPWTIQATLPGAVLTDLSFVNTQVGFAVAERGQVYKTTDGGESWIRPMNLGSPFHWYGVSALNADDVVISGFNNGASYGMIRWSHDGGATWTPDIILTSTRWSDRIRFSDSAHAVVLDLTGGSGHYTSTGGAALTDWSHLTIDPSLGWFGSQFSLLPNGHARASGIKYCASQDNGASWTCRPSIDPVFDGAVFFVDDDHGWVGGGMISPSVEGWLYRTEDGGETWSQRTLHSPWPVREIRFLSPELGWAVGGDIHVGRNGGFFFTADGGQTWSHDRDSLGYEMSSCDSKPLQGGYKVWCVGFNNSLDGVVYTVQTAATPALDPLPGTYHSGRLVTISAPTEGATIHYTEDGSLPTADSPVYSAPITITTSSTIRAIAIAPGYAQSTVAGGLYTVTSAPQLTLSTSPSNLSVRGGHSVTAQLTVSSDAPLSSPVTFSCSGLPTGASCVFSPSSLDAAAISVPVTLTISTPAAAVAVSNNGLPWLTSTVVPAVLFLPLLGKRRRRLFAPTLAVVLVLLSMSWLSCGSNGGTVPPPIVRQPESYRVTVTAASAGADSATAQIALTVTH